MLKILLYYQKILIISLKSFDGKIYLIHTLNIISYSIGFSLTKKFFYMDLFQFIH